MAAGTKTFQTNFKINATWTGQAAVAKATGSLRGVAQAAQHVNVHMKGMWKEVFKGEVAMRVAAKAFDLFTEGLRKSIEAASDVQRVHDALGTALQRNASRYKNLMGKSVAEATKIINESKEALIAASEQMEQTGHDAETLQAGWTKLAATAALDPKQILEQRQAFSDVLSYISGANAKAEDSERLGELWADAILRGNIALAKQMDLTDGEINLLRNVNSMVKKGTITGEEGIKRRQDLMLKFAKKFDGETKRVFETPTGKIAQMWTQVSNIFENLGKPFVERSGEMADSFNKIAKEVQPISEKLADIVDVQLKGIGTWLDEHGKEVPGRIDEMVTMITKLWDILMKIKNVLQAIEDFEFGGVKWLYEHLWKSGVGEPARMPQLPGAPSGVVNPALQGGKAGQRAAEAAARAKEESESLYKPGYPSAMPGHILKDFKVGEQTAAAAWGPVATAAAAKGAQAAVQGAPPANIRGVLGGVLAGHEADFEAAGKKYGVDPKLLMAIAEFETGHGKSFSARTRNNIAGIMNPKNPSQHMVYKSIEEGIDAQAALLKRGYISKGLTTIPQIARKYSPPGASNDPNKTNAEWPASVQREYDRISKASGGTAAKTAAPPAVKELTETVKKAEAVTRSQGTKMLLDPSKQDPFGVKYGPWNQPKPAPPPKPLDYGAGRGAKVSMEDAMMKDPRRQGLSRMIKEMNIDQRTSGATGGQNIAMNAPITVNGVAPGREALMAKQTALALRDPTAQLLTGIKKAQRQEARTGYV